MNLPLNNILIEEFGIDNSILARTIADTGIVISPLIPWNVNSLFILSTTGILTTEYAPYAVLCYLSPLITFILGFIYDFYSRKMRHKWDMNQ